VPHLGWNRVDTSERTSQLLAGIASGAFAYFAHSFAAPIGPDAAATTRHGATFASVVERDNVFGAQFHPELSGDTGARIFLNFAAIVEGRTL
jgi:glutamine amidotransferase